MNSFSVSEALMNQQSLSGVIISFGGHIICCKIGWQCTWLRHICSIQQWIYGSWCSSWNAYPRHILSVLVTVSLHKVG